MEAERLAGTAAEGGEGGSTWEAGGEAIALRESGGVWRMVALKCAGAPSPE